MPTGIGVKKKDATENAQEPNHFAAMRGRGLIIIYARECLMQIRPEVTLTPEPTRTNETRKQVTEAYQRAAVRC